jgi:hypothetical protein
LKSVYVGLMETLPLDVLKYITGWLGPFHVVRLLKVNRGIRHMLLGAFEVADGREFLKARTCKRCNTILPLKEGWCYLCVGNKGAMWLKHHKRCTKCSRSEKNINRGICEHGWAKNICKQEFPCWFTCGVCWKHLDREPLLHMKTKTRVCQYCSVTLTDLQPIPECLCWFQGFAGKY